jgi:hypothetical protein
VTDLVYVYAILPRSLAIDLAGIDGRPLRWVVEDGLAAAVSDVPAAEFEEEPLNASIRDLSWLGPRAVAHEDVNERLWASSAASVPLAFGTVFRDDERVRQLLRDQSAALRARLEAVAGRAEWVLALHRTSPSSSQELAQSSQELRALRAQIESSSPGRAHLLRRRAAELEREAARRLDMDAADALVELLRTVVDDVFREPLPSDSLERPLARLSVLVKRSGEQRFLGSVEQARARWPEPTYRLQLTGPWPPYRFGGLERAHG